VILHKSYKKLKTDEGDKGYRLGYSDYDFFQKMIEVHGYIGEKSNSKTLLKHFEGH
jgi:hypothetical protein